MQDLIYTMGPSPNRIPGWPRRCDVCKEPVLEGQRYVNRIEGERLIGAVVKVHLDCSPVKDSVI